MSNLIVVELEKIKNPLLKAFAFRVYNVFKSIILPIVLGAMLVQLQNHPNDLTCLGEVQFWLNILYAVLVAVVGSAIAGLDKVSRERTEG